MTIPGYTITAVGPDGEPLPDVAVEISPAEGGFSWAWYEPAALKDFSRLLIWLERGQPGKLCIDGREYRRRQLARRKAARRR